MHPDDTLPCFRAHLGLWAIEPTWLIQAVQALQHDLWPIRAPELLAAEMTRAQGKLYAQTEDGVAVIRIEGQITKGLSKFGGTSTILTRRALRQAAAAEDITSMLLAIDSPGGQVDGIQDLADEVQRARQSKIVDAYIEDLGASAAYWIASQARRITANATGFVGSIGAFAVLEDLSGLAAREGVQTPPRPPLRQCVIPPTGLSPVCNFQTFVALLIRIRWPLEELDGANHQALPCRFHDLPRNLCQGIDFHQACDLRQQTVEQTEIATGDPDDGRQHICIG
jgi:hypothetical protein